MQCSSGCFRALVSMPVRIFFWSPFNTMSYCGYPDTFQPRQMDGSIFTLRIQTSFRLSQWLRAHEFEIQWAPCHLDLDHSYSRPLGLIWMSWRDMQLPGSRWSYMCWLSKPNPSRARSATRVQPVLLWTILPIRDIRSSKKKPTKKANNKGLAGFPGWFPTCASWNRVWGSRISKPLFRDCVLLYRWYSRWFAYKQIRFTSLCYKILQGVQPWPHWQKN